MPTPKKATAQEPCLLRARDSLLQAAADDATALAWVTGLSFEDLRSAIGQSFSGIPGRADGEPTCSWMLSDFKRDSKVKDDTMKFIISGPLYESMMRRTLLDVSIRTHDGEGLASTAVLWDYKPPRSALGRIRDKAISKWHENALVFKLRRQGGLPQTFVSKEWKAERGALNRRGSIAIGALAEMHVKHGPRHRHWYVNFVASNPDLQGQGYGSKVMRKVCELADDEKADCFLDCGLDNSKRFYERFGFVVVASHVLDSGDADRMIVYGMVRTFQECRS